jgi:hypothetical protein
MRQVQQTLLDLFQQVLRLGAENFDRICSAHRASTLFTTFTS